MVGHRGRLLCLLWGRVLREREKLLSADELVATEGRRTKYCDGVRARKLRRGGRGGQALIFCLRWPRYTLVGRTARRRRARGCAEAGVVGGYVRYCRASCGQIVGFFHCVLHGVRPVSFEQMTVPQRCPHGVEERAESPLDHPFCSE